MTDPERSLREELARIAEEVETGVPLAQRARAARRRRGRRSVALGAAAVVVLAFGGALPLHGAGSAPSGDVPAQRATDGSAAARGSYRLELWQGLGVYVPATWGWGGAPGACGVGPTVGPDGHRLSASEIASGVLSGYVGRPVDQAGPCTASERSTPRTPYAWLGADVHVGVVDLGDGWVQETRAVAGTTVTVASNDPSLREEILSSAHSVSFPECPVSMSEPPHPAQRGAGQFSPVSLTVCAYAPITRTASGGSGAYRLLYGEHLPAGHAKELADAVAKAAPLGQFSCFGASGGEWALLHLAANGGQSRDYVVDLSCPSIADARGLQRRLTSADVLPWAVDGVNAVLHANALIDVPGRLIGP